MQELTFIPKSELDRVVRHINDREKRLEIIADICRLNTLVEIKKAGSGHLGSSFSAMDLVVWLYFHELNILSAGIGHADRDIFFSSKGHDVPGLYAVLYAQGVLTEEQLFKLRRLGGLDGHPDVGINGCEANTGSLGMGISKAQGMVWAKKYLSRRGRVFVMVGDGELQEGQIWESLQTSSHHHSDVTVIVDHNKVQTDMPVEEVIGLGDLKRKLQAFDWHVERCNGHDFADIGAAFERLARVGPTPRILIADTIKGRGVTFMEEISEQASSVGKYRWHSGAPEDDTFRLGFKQLLDRLNSRLRELKLEAVSLEPVPMERLRRASVTRKYVGAAYGDELVRLAKAHPDLVILDGDLSADCHIRKFEEAYPKRFIENGIAEQNMVSLAGGLALQGLLPVCNSFSSFLCARANEQIYNNACEGTKIIYAAHFAGTIPAGPGKSHQSVRDIGLLGSIPNLIIAQPCNPEEARRLTRWAVEEANENICLRMNIGPSPRDIVLPSEDPLQVGVGCVLRQGNDAVLFSYGAVMLNEALLAAELASKSGFGLEVANMPWLNRFDTKWLNEILTQHTHVYTLDDHMLAGGMGERLTAVLGEAGLLSHRHIRRFGLQELPACGTPAEVLHHHALDGESLARQILLIQDRPFNSGQQREAVFDTLEAAQ